LEIGDLKAQCISAAISGKPERKIQVIAKVAVPQGSIGLAFPSLDSAGRNAADLHKFGFRMLRKNPFLCHSERSEESCSGLFQGTARFLVACGSWE
jgi:hypothetical protein